MKNLTTKLAFILSNLIFVSCLNLSAQHPDFTIPFSSNGGNPIHGTAVECNFPTNLPCLHVSGHTIQFWDSVTISIPSSSAVTGSLHPWDELNITFTIDDAYHNPVTIIPATSSKFTNVTYAGNQVTYHLNLAAMNNALNPNPTPGFNVNWPIMGASGGGNQNCTIDLELDIDIDLNSVVLFSHNLDRFLRVSHAIELVDYDTNPATLNDITHEYCRGMRRHICCEGNEPCPEQGTNVDPDPSENDDDTGAHRLGNGGVAIQSSYPNPFATHTNIVVAIPESSSYDVTIVDMQGRHIDFSFVENSRVANQLELKLNLSHVAAGVYFAKVNCPQGRFIYKLIKTNQ